MTNLQNNEFTLRLSDNVKRMVQKGLDPESAKKAVFEEMNAKYPTALASWLKSNAD